MRNFSAFIEVYLFTFQYKKVRVCAVPHSCTSQCPRTYYTWTNEVDFPVAKTVCLFGQKVADILMTMHLSTCNSTFFDFPTEQLYI